MSQCWAMHLVTRFRRGHRDCGELEAVLGAVTEQLFGQEGPGPIIGDYRTDFRFYKSESRLSDPIIPKANVTRCRLSV